MGCAEMDRVWQERAIRSWFSMWLEGQAGDLTELFALDVQYIESWGRSITACPRSGTGSRSGTPAGGSWSGNCGAFCTMETAP